MTMIDGPSFGPMAGGAPTGLVVLCHGVGSDGFDLIDLAPVWGRAAPNALFRSPHGPEPYDAAPMGRQWFPLWDRSPAMLTQGVKVAAIALGTFIDAELARLGLAPDAYVLMGFSQGAMTALHAGLTHKTPPRAILAYSGRLLDDEALSPPPKSRILLVHGAEDQVVPADSSRQAARKITAAGGNAELVICPGLGHGIDEPGLRAGFRVLREAFAPA
jgi:phospholipase/carboxylesterase